MRKKKQLLWQLYPSYLVIIVISLAAVSWYACGSLRGFFLSMAAEDLGARAHLIERPLLDLIREGNNGDAVSRFVKESGARSRTRITVILPSGKVVGDSEKDFREMENHALRPEVVKALKGTPYSYTRFSDTIGMNMMYMAIPLMEGGEIEGVVRASVSVSSIDENIRNIQFNIAFAGILIILLAAGIGLFISRRIIQPIQAMQQGAQRFAEGDLTHKLHIPDSEEMASLAGTMNRMAKLLHERINTVENQRNELDAVLSSMVEGVVAVDENERIININKAGAALIKGDRNKLKGKSVPEVVRNVEFQRFNREALAKEGPHSADIVLYHFDERILHVRSTPLRYDTQGKKGILMILNDVTQLRRLENMRSDFAANVSHEIKTPLTSIKGFVETLRHQAMDNPEEARRFLSIIDKNVTRLNAIIENLLSLSRIEKEDERREIILEKSVLRGTLNAAVQACAHRIEEKMIRVDLECDSAIKARIDNTLLEQAVVNLIDNAVHFSDEGGTIQISAKLTNEGVRIDVRDHGAGIAKEHIPRLFERFYRVDKSRSRKEGGTGLGLAIVKHIIQAHDGKVTVGSKLGGGSTFSIHLPPPA